MLWTDTKPYQVCREPLQQRRTPQEPSTQDPDSSQLLVGPEEKPIQQEPQHHAGGSAAGDATPGPNHAGIAQWPSGIGAVPVR
jgi:hypothetical protein